LPDSTASAPLSTDSTTVDDAPLLLLPADGPADLVVGCSTALRHGQAPELDEAVAVA